MRIMKKAACILIIFVMIMNISVVFANEIKLFLDGEEVFCDPEPVIIDGRTLIPVRALFEKMGAQVSWNADTREVGIVYENTSIKMTLDSKTAIVSGKAVGLEVAPSIIADRTMIPLRFVGEAIGAQVSWNPDTRRIDILSPKNDENETDDIRSNVIISDVSFAKRGDHDVFAFGVSGKYSLTTMNLDNPERMVFDIAGGEFSSEKIDGDGNYVTMRIGNHEKYARIVAESKEPVRYIYADNGGVVSIKFYEEKINYDFLGGTEKKIIFPEGAKITSSLKDNELTLTVKGVGTEDEDMRIGDELVKDISVEGKKVTVSLNGKAEVKTDGNCVILTKTAENKGDENSSSESRLVVLDAGHGGADPGSLGKDETGEEVIAYEKDMNLSITLKVERILKENGVDVLLTRDDDVYVGLAERAEYANAKNAALFVSIHNNSIPQPEYKGSMVLYYLTSEKGKILAKNILSEMTKSAGTIDRGLRDGTNMAVIKRTDMPAVIVECGCLTNAEELENLMDDAFLEKLALGIAKGIMLTLEG